MSDDGGGFRARAARYAKVSTRVGGLAAGGGALGQALAVEQQLPDRIG